MQLPDITPAQIKSDVTFVVGIAASLGFKFDGSISDTVAAALIGGVAFAKAVDAVVDAAIRRGRAANADKIAAAAKKS